MSSGSTRNLITLIGSVGINGSSSSPLLEDGYRVEWGSADGADGASFGAITDGAIDPYGRVAILDAMSRELSVLRADQAHPLHVSGQRGSGPGEFLHPVAIDFDESGNLYVFERMGMVSVYELVADKLVYKHRFGLPVAIYDACIVREDLFIHGHSLQAGGVIHVYSIGSKRHQRSFGDGYLAGSRLIRSQLSRGMIACGRRTGIIVYLASLVPEVLAYSASGKRLWSARFENVEQSRVYETAGGSRLEIPRGTHTRPYGAVMLETSNTVALQFETINRDQDGHITDRHITTVALSTRDGSVAFSRHGGLRWVSTRGGSILASSSEPFPRAFFFSDPLQRNHQ